jgi:hypothetical protein
MRNINGVGNLLCPRFPVLSGNGCGNGFDTGFPDRLVNGVTNLLSSDFGNILAIGNFVIDGDFIIDRLVARNFLVFKDDFSGDACHFLAMLDVIGALRRGITGTDPAETGVGGRTEQRQDAGG